MNGQISSSNLLRWRTWSWCSIAAFLLSVAAAPPSSAQQEDPSQDESQTEPTNQMHWAVQLGLRVHQLEMAIPLIDQVVLVPDESTYVQEIAKWSPSGRWPVLIEDDQYCSMFIRRFKPQRVLRRAPGKPLIEDKKERQSTLNAVVIKVLGGQPQDQTLAEVLEANKYLPPGIVVTSIEDPAWTAALALAAGRAQPLVWLDGDLGATNDALALPQSMKLIEMTREILNSVGLPWEEKGDVIETLTICRTVPISAHLNMPAEAQPPVPDRSPGEMVLATMDSIGRNSVAERGVFTAWIFGDRERCAYVAMCSLFLPRSKVTLIDGYGAKSEGMDQYEMSQPALALEKLGYEVTLYENEQASSLRWQRRLAGGLDTDLLFMNSRGGARRFNLTGGTRQAIDVPILNTPLAVEMIHSYSMQMPADSSTIAGMWLTHGAYAYVGSMSEPYLAAFVPTMIVAKRLANFVPFVVSCRWWIENNPFALPWRISTYGDPLMLAAPPSRTNIQRTAPPDDGQVDLRTQTQQLMRSAIDSNDETMYAKAIDQLVLLGEDQVAIEFWRIARQHGAEAAVSTHILGPLFRAKDRQDFLKAWQSAKNTGPLQRDMLWHLLGNELTFETDPNVIDALSQNLRIRSRGIDLTRLAPYLAKTQGTQVVRTLAEAELKAARERKEPRIKQVTNRYEALIAEY